MIFRKTSAHICSFTAHLFIHIFSTAAGFTTPVFPCRQLFPEVWNQSNMSRADAASFSSPNPQGLCSQPPPHAVFLVWVKRGLKYLYYNWGAKFTLWNLGCWLWCRMSSKFPNIFKNWKTSSGVGQVAQPLRRHPVVHCARQNGSAGTWFNARVSTCWCLSKMIAAFVLPCLWICFLQTAGYLSFIFTPWLCNFGVYPPISIVFPFVGVFLCVRGKAYSKEYVSRHVSTFTRDIKHTDDTLPNLVKGRSKRRGWAPLFRTCNLAKEIKHCSSTGNIQ